MSLIGKIASGIVVGAELLDIIRYTSTPIESLGVRPDYGDDGTGWGIVSIPEEPVDPEKLEFGIGLSPVIIFGKGEVCVGANVGLGYEVKFLVCHRSEPVDEPAPIVVPPPPLEPPFGLPEPPPLEPPQFDSDELVVLFAKETRVQSWRGDSPGASFEASEFFGAEQIQPESAFSYTAETSEIIVSEVMQIDDFTDSISFLFKSQAILEKKGNNGPIFEKSSETGSSIAAVKWTFQVDKIKKTATLVSDARDYRMNPVVSLQTQVPILLIGKWADLRYSYDIFQKYKYSQYTFQDTAPKTFDRWVVWSSGTATRTITVPRSSTITRGVSRSYQVAPLKSFGREFFPPPSISLPPPICKEMECCGNKDTEELIRLIAKNLGVSATGYFMELPKSMVIAESSLFGKTDASETVKVKSQAEFNAYLLQALSAINGQFEVTIDVPARISKATKGEAERIAGTITIPDIANGIAIITKLLLNLQDDEADMRSFLTRILLETHLSRRSAARAAEEAYALRLWTGMRITEESASMPCTFSPPQEIVGKDIDAIDTDAEVKGFLRESNVPYKKIRYADKAGFKEIAHQLLQGVAILRAVFGIRFGKGSVKDQMKSLVRQTHSNAQGRPAKSPASPDLSDDDFKKFVRDQAKQRGIEIEFVGAGEKK